MSKKFQVMIDFTYPRDGQYGNRHGLASMVPRIQRQKEIILQWALVEDVGKMEQGKSYGVAGDTEPLC